MEKPRTSQLSWWERLFGGGSTPQPTPTPPPIINPGTDSTSVIITGRRFSTSYAKNNSTMLAQLEEAHKYKAFIEEAARRYQFQPAVLCGIGSRESHWGLALKPPGPGGRGDFARRPPRGDRKTAIPPDGPGYGRGLMQIDYDWHEFARTGKWYSARDNILYACTVLESARKFFAKQTLRLNEDQTLRAILAAYNAGATATTRVLEAGKDVDAATTGKDYSRDVLNRSGWFQLHGWQ